MALSDFAIDQTGLSAGIPTVSRRDILPTSVAGGPVTFEAVTAGLTYKWEVTQTPGSSVALTGSGSQTCTLAAELEGGYLVRLTVNANLPTEDISELYFGIGIVINGVRYPLPALTETIQDNSVGTPEYGWLDKILGLFRALSGGVVTGVLWDGTASGSTPTEIFVGGVSGNREIVPIDTAVAYSITVVAFNSYQNKTKTWKIECTAQRTVYNETTLVDIPVITILAQTGTPGSGSSTDLWDVEATVDDSDDTLVLTVTGEYGESIHWTAKAEKTSSYYMGMLFV